MGLLSLLRKLRKSDKEARILILGLDNSGKTTILKKLSDEDTTTIMPTQGFNIKSLVHDGFKLNVWDVGGQKSIRAYWTQYLKDVGVLVYVVDSADLTRLEEVNKELGSLLAEEDLAGVPLLVFANKQDLMGSLSAADISTGLNLESITGRTWSIQACSAKRGDGLEEGLAWAVEQLKIKDGEA